MDNVSKIGSLSTADLLSSKSQNTDGSSGSGFADALKDAIGDVNSEQVKADSAMTDLATGQVKDLHQAALAIGKAEISMKMMLEVRNKALSAYQTIVKTPM
ncbi:MAG: flagellar hook-basal body complex protein FliE [Campylobacterota bacterium]|nr:flagellar hook-basal body complex protein FliE [Campylobacterota bacterium]